MRARLLAGAGVSAIALVAAAAFVPAANASSTAKYAPTASLASGHQGKVAVTKSASIDKKGKCGTGFGPEFPTVDGLIAWNDGGAFDTAGAADVKCGASKTINKVLAYGYFGAVTETFHVTFYKDSTTSGSSEPNDSAVICDYPALTGAAGGAYPTHVKTKLALTTPCVLPAGTSWVSIQNVNPSGPWYWEMQDATGGSTNADWVDRFDAFGSGCTTFDNDRYLVDCLGYTYPDFMLKLR